MLQSPQLEKFHRDGFVKGSVFLTDEQIEILQNETLRVIEERDSLERKPVRVANLSGNPEAAVWQVVNIWEASDAFQELVFNSTLVEEVAQLMQAEMDAHEIRLFHDQIQYKPAQKGGVNMWHQDSPYWPILQPKDVQLTAWVALDDAEEDNGCMSMVPGSQKWGDKIGFLNALKEWDGLPEQFEGHAVDIVPCPVQRGQVHFHHPLTWHGSPSNKSGRPRRAIALHFMTEKAVFDSKGMHPMKPFVEGEPGEKVTGEHFPKVWSKSEAMAEAPLA